MLLRAFTRIDLIATLAALLLLAALVAIGMLRSRGESRKQKDGDQLRQLHQAFVVWPQGGNDDYALPSRFDRANYTLDAESATKDTTSNIYSVLVFNHLISPEALFSPAETNLHIRPYTTYEYERPTRTASPQGALGDPKLSATLDGSTPGHISYAHLQPFGERKSRWCNSFNDSEAVLATRGPEIDTTTANPDSSMTPTLANPSSNTLRFYGRGRTWSGWAAFNDNHVDFRSDYLKHGRAFNPLGGVTYTTSANTQLSDIWCYDEPDDPKAANDYIGIFLKAGAKREDWTAAWD